ncbi:MAG: hypothetical protein KAI35_08530 [Desulfobulbaceae bacterium]|nr:hypothetical protein [Desulfobulbaceae bacterium]
MGRKKSGRKFQKGGHVRHILTISKIALIESIRDRIFSALLLFLGLFLLLSVYISTLSLGTVARFIENSGMLGISLVCLMVTILSSIFSLYREKERNELYLFLNRVPRHTYLLGRFLGASYLIAIFSLFAGTCIFSLTWIFGHTIAFELFWAVYWAILEFTLLIGIGFLFFSAGTGFTLNSLMLIAVFVVGHSLTEAIQSFVGLGVLGNRYHLMLVKLVSYLFPNFDMFDFRLAIVHAEPVVIGQAVIATCYWFFYLAAVLSLSAAIFNRRDI